MKPIISQQAIEDSKGEQKEKSDFKFFYTVPQREYENVLPALHLQRGLNMQPLNSLQLFERGRESF